MSADIPTNIQDWSTTAASNLPVGTTAIAQNLDDNLRVIQSAVRALFARETIASAATCDIGAKNVRSLDVTGAITITSFGTPASVGIKRLLTFAGALTITNSASLACITGGNITTEAGDMCEMEAVTAGWQMLWYSRKSGASLAIGGLVVDGSAGTPALRFINSPTTGIYRQAADSIGFSAAGTLRVTLNTTGLTSTLPLTVPETGATPSIRSAGVGSHSLGLASNSAVLGYSNVSISTSTTGVEARSLLPFADYVLNINQTSSSLADTLLNIEYSASVSTAKDAIRITGDINGTPNLVWRVRADGATFADGAYSGAGADYAEAFLVSGEMPQPGDPVVLVNDRVSIATDLDQEEDIIGVVSESACAIGDARLLDIGGVPVGLVGKLRVNPGRPIKPSWRPLGDGRYLIGVA